MAPQISPNAYSGRSIAFWGLPQSRVINDALSAEDAIVQSGLDWDVLLTPAQQLLSDGSYREVPNSFHTVRSDTEAVLGTVKGRYKIFNNREAFSFANGLLEHGAEFDVAGAYDNDAKIFLSASLPEGIKVEGEDDMALNLLFKTTHDGSGSITALVTPTRLACLNQMGIALKSAVSKWTCRHTKSAADRVDEAVKTLRIVSAYREEYEASIAQLLETEVTLEGFETLIKEITPSERTQQSMLNVWKTSPVLGRPNTGFAALNAVSEATEWLPSRRTSAETRFDSLMDGNIANTRTAAARLLLRR